MLKNENKKYQLEILRIIAIFFVIYNHTRNNGYELYKYDFSIFNHYFSLALAILCKVAVPLFFMISGVVLLGKEETIKDFLKKRVLRMLIVIIVFTLLQYIRIIIANPESRFDFAEFCISCYSQNIIDTYWYLKAYLGFLLIVPFLRMIVKEESLSKYLAVLMVLKLIATFVMLITGYYPNISITFLTDVIFYPLMGYYIEVSKRHLGSKSSIVICSLIILISLIANTLFLKIYYLKTGEWSEQAKDLLLPVIVLSLFILVLSINIKSDKIKNIICQIASTTFGIYLIEDVLRNIFEFRLNWNFELPQKMISAILFVLAVQALGTVCIYIIKKIPFVTKYI